MKKREHHFVEKDWGNEVWFENNELYCGKILTIEKGKWSSKGKRHYHPVKDETFFILNGTILLEVEGEAFVLGAGQSHRIFPGQMHRFKGITDCQFVEVSTTHNDEDSIRVEN